MFDSALNYLLKLDSWAHTVGDEYGVNPYIFIFLYFGLAPVFWGVVGYVIHNYRKSKPVIPYLIITAVLYFLPYAYLFAAGNNLPLWVYIAAVILIIIGAIISFKRIRKLARRQKALQIQKEFYQNMSDTESIAS